MNAALGRELCAPLARGLTSRTCARSCRSPFPSQTHTLPFPSYGHTARKLENGRVIRREFASARDGEVERWTGEIVQSAHARRPRCRQVRMRVRGDHGALG